MMQPLAFAKFCVNEEEWIHFGDTRETADSEENNGAEMFMGWLAAMDMVHQNTVTLIQAQELQHAVSDAKNNTLKTFKLVNTFMPQLQATQDELSSVLKIGVYLLMSPTGDTAHLARLCVFMNLQAVLRTWAAARTIPCFSDVFRLLSFYQMSAPPSCAYGGNGTGCFAECAAWMRQHDSRLGTPAVFRGMLAPQFFRIPNTPIVIDTATHTIQDLYEVGGEVACLSPALPCPGGVLSGEAGSGKFSSFLDPGMRVKHASALPARTHCSNATLFIVPAGGLAWRLTQARLQHPMAIIVKISTACDLKHVRWEQLVAAEYIFTTFQFISTPKYLRHFNKVVYALAAGSARLSGASSGGSGGGKTSSNKRRRIDVDVGVDVNNDARDPATDEFDVGLQASKLAPTSIEDDAIFACNCVRRLLDASALKWEGLTTPVLEVLTYNRVVFLDCDRQRTYPRRLQHFVGTSRWATALVAPPVVDLAVFVLPPEVVRVPNATVKRNLVELCMTFFLKKEAGPPAVAAAQAQEKDEGVCRVTCHTRLPMTPREVLTCTRVLDKDLAACRGGEEDALLKNISFTTTADMHAAVLAAAQDRIQSIVAERDALKETLEKAEADRAEAVANGTATTANFDNTIVTAEINYEYWGADVNFVTITTDMAGNEDDEEYFYEDDDDDDDDDEDEDDDDDDDENNELVELEEIMLATTPARIREKIQKLTAQIDDFGRDDAALKSRVAAAIMDVINVEPCIICSQAKSNAMPPCGHAFCSTCLSTWRESKGTCPACSKTFKTIVVTEECEDVPSPDASQVELWARVRRAPRDLSSLLFWFLCTLRAVEAQGRRCVIVTVSSQAGRALRAALVAEGVAVLHFAGSLASRFRALDAFKRGAAHVVVQSSDVLAGAGFSNARDVVFGDDVNPEPTSPLLTDAQRAVLLTRFNDCEAVFTYSRVRSQADA